MLHRWRLRDASRDKLSETSSDRSLGPNPCETLCVPFESDLKTAESWRTAAELNANGSLQRGRGPKTAESFTAKHVKRLCFSASTGPQSEDCGEFIGRSASQAVPRGFNGAAVRRLRRGIPVQVPRVRKRFCFNGAAVRRLRRGCDARHVRPHHCRLQRGRSPKTAERRFRNARSTPQLFASTGPQSEDCGESLRDRPEEQWWTSFNGAAVRRLRRDEIRAAEGRRSCRFNGAAVRRLRRECSRNRLSIGAWSDRLRAVCRRDANFSPKQAGEASKVLILNVRALLRGRCATSALA
jgi:hypothetical protein